MRFGYVFFYQVCVKRIEGGLLYLPFKFAERWITKCIFATFFVPGLCKTQRGGLLKVFTRGVGPVHLKCALTNIGARTHRL